MTTLLIADDEQSFLDFMVRLLQKDHELLIARNWNEVLEKFESNLWRLNATILDVNMPGLFAASHNTLKNYMLRRIILCKLSFEPLFLL